MTNQELYSTSRNHLLTQMQKSLRSNELSREDSLYPSKCAYRGVGGLKCAIGCLIPDERYDPTLEGFSVYSERVQKAAEYTEEQNVLAGALQRVHDTCEPNNWQLQLDKVAERFELDPK